MSIELESVSNQELPKYNPVIPHLNRFDDFKTIDWVNDNLESNRVKIDLIRTRRSSNYLLELTTVFRLYIILTVVGIVIGFVAASLNIITEYLSNIRTGYCSNAFYLNRSFCCWGEAEETCSNWVEYSRFGLLRYVIFILISLVFSYTSSKLVLSYAPFAAGSGISEIKCIVSGFTFDKFLNFWTFLMKSIGLPLAIASGLSVGKEGPSVHYAVCVGSIISKLFAMNLSNASSFRNILVASSGAGVAVAFGSPMGGVLFSIEEISNLFKLSTMWETYYCSLIAVAVLQLMNPFRTGQVVMFEVKFDQNWHIFEIPFYVILGLFGGVYGIIISKFNIKAVSFRKKFLGSFAIQEVLILTAISAMISYFNQFLRSDMTESMQKLFQTCKADSEEFICQLDSKSQIFQILLSLIYATLVRMVLIVFTYGCKVPAGIFVPSMACGATFGRALGLLAQLLRQWNPSASYFTSGCLADDKYCINPGIYAFLGAGAALSGITHLTVTVVIILFELTGALKYVIPSMITVAVTKVINDKFGKGGIADQMIEFNGLPLIHPHEDLSFNGHKAVDAMTSNVIVFNESGLSFRELKNILSRTSFQNFPIVQSFETPKIRGLLRREDIELIIEEYTGELHDDLLVTFTRNNIYNEESIYIDFSPKINHAPIIIELDCSLEIALQFFHKVGPRCILVEEDGELRGLVTTKDILRYHYYLHDLHVDHSEAHNEQTFRNDDQIWNSIIYSGTYLNSLYQRVYYNITSRRGNDYTNVNIE